MEKRFLTVDEVAQRFGVNPTTVYRLVKGRVLPAIKVGSQWRFSQRALAFWVAQQMGHAPQEPLLARQRRRSRRP